ncbi:hypothetical protein [uncultured Corynebacterium sp.]|uniref:hypothetical protein n=1 Tax=uncultured Corynebacterium sp. TaxID=159447 RepID=UPI0025F681B6|nr:hypothetical protein [uncultured Corynebacterium sp.]
MTDRAADDAAASGAATGAPTSKYDDPRVPLLAAAKSGAIALVVVTIGSLLVWSGMEGVPGVWGVVLGAAIGGGFVLLTVISVLATAKSTPTMTGAVVMFGWLAKIVVLILILLVLRDMTFYDPMAFFVTVVLAMMVTIGAEVWGMSQSNLTYVTGG